MLEAGGGATAVELSHQAIVFGTEDNTGGVHGRDHASDLVEGEGLGLGLFLGSHVEWRVFRLLGEGCRDSDLSVAEC